MPEVSKGFRQHTVVLQLEPFAIILALTRHEVVLRHLHRLTVHQARQVVAQEFVIDGLDVIEVILSVRQFRRIQTVHEVVVGRERERTESTGEELH